tara:strand:- start:3171 stop:3431 length:261 start_codon:yes stop_codon:yes gene_type:complete
MDEIISKQAKQVLSKEEYQEFMSYIFAKNIKDAKILANKVYEISTNDVLETVYKDECDFVLMSQYRKCNDLLSLVIHYGLKLDIND